MKLGWGESAHLLQAGVQEVARIVFPSRTADNAPLPSSISQGGNPPRGPVSWSGAEAAVSLLAFLLPLALMSP